MLGIVFLVAMGQGATVGSGPDTIIVLVYLEVKDMVEAGECRGRIRI